MKKFLKAIWTIEHPLGEIWLFLFGAIILFVFGIIDFEILLDNLIPISLLAAVVLLVSLVSLWFERRNKK